MAGWIDDKKKDGDIQFAVRTTTPFKDPARTQYTGMFGPYATLAGARRKAKQEAASHKGFESETWFKNVYTGWKVEIFATKIEWHPVAHIGEST